MWLRSPLIPPGGVLVREGGERLAGRFCLAGCCRRFALGGRRRQAAHTHVLAW